VSTKIVLPFGLGDSPGNRARTAALTPLTGHGELFGADDPNPFRAVLGLLAASIGELGPFHGAQIDPALLGQLLPVDRDYLLLHLNRLTFGDERYQTLECPHARCGRRLEVRFTLSSADRPEVPERATGAIALPGGQLIRFRLPTAADQSELHDVAPPELEAEFLRRCVRSEAGSLVGWSELMAMPAAIRTAVVKHIVAASPEIDLAVPVDCVECSQPFRFVFDPVRSLLAELEQSRAELIKQVHRLALNYHWSQSEILSLPNALRREYLTLLQDAGR
jgi:hypothetical protein